MANNKLTLKVTKLAFYNGALVYPNEIIKNFKGDKVPSWATLAGGKEIKPEEKTPVEPQNPVNPEEEGNKEPEKKEPETKLKTEPEEAEGEQTGTAEEKTPVEPQNPVNPEEEKSEVELQEELDALLDESVSKGIILEGAENKTLVEQIAELKVLLGK